MFQDFENAPLRSTSEGATRLADVRRLMRLAKLDAFIVPREDAYQGEYVPPYGERLNWLTGFNGSAGLAVVLPRKAALFVDGRYVLQAAYQVDKKLFTPIHSAEVSPARWLLKNLKKNARVGLDARLHTQNFVTRLAKHLSTIGAKIVMLPTNPIDKLWQERPAPPATKVEGQPLRLTGRSSFDKRKTLAKQMREAGIDATPISKPENIAWLLNIRGRDVPHTPFALSFGVLHKSGRFDWYIEKHRVSNSVMKAVGKNVTICKPAQLAAGLAALAKKSIALDATSTPAWFVQQLKNSRIIEAPDPCALPKACKTKAEIKGAEAAHKRDGVALCQFLCWLEATAPDVKITEIDAAQKIEAFRMASGHLRDLSFDSISGTAAHGAIVHYRVTHATNQKLRNGDIYLLDSGGQYSDGTTDVTRTLLIGTKKPKREVVDAFTRVLRGHIALAMVQFPHGTSGTQLDALARAPLWAAGLDFAHGTGHGVGSYLSVHEGPHRISKGGDEPLRDGMIVSNEPGYYKAGDFGIRIENLQYVVPLADMLCFKTLTLAPIERRLIDPTMLAPDERAWLNAYHKRVAAEITPHLPDAATKRWLKRVCKNL